jgi:hypothetical protein
MPEISNVIGLPPTPPLNINAGLTSLKSRLCMGGDVYSLYGLCIGFVAHGFCWQCSALVWQWCVFVGLCRALIGMSYAGLAYLRGVCACLCG